MTTGGSASGSETKTSRANLPRNSFRTRSQAKNIPTGNVTAVATMAVCSDNATIEISEFIEERLGLGGLGPGSLVLRVNSYGASSMGTVREKPADSNRVRVSGVLARYSRNSSAGAEFGAPVNALPMYSIWACPPSIS